MDKAALLSSIKQQRIELENVLSRFSDSQMIEPALHGGWSVKDLLAHVEFWEGWVVRLFETLQQGDKPEETVTNDTLDALNDQIFRKNQSLDLVEVLQNERAAYQNLIHKLESAPEDDLFDANRFGWTGGQPFFNYFIWNSSEHWAEHLENLRSLLEKFWVIGNLCGR